MGFMKNAINWLILKINRLLDWINANDDELKEYHLYKLLGLYHSKNKVLIVGSIRKDFDKKLKAKIRYCRIYGKKNPSELEVVINTDGGNHFSTMRAIEYLNKSNITFKSVKAIRAYSGGMLLFVHIKAKEYTMPFYGRLMSHDTQLDIRCELQYLRENPLFSIIRYGDKKWFINQLKNRPWGTVPISYYLEAFPDRANDECNSRILRDKEKLSKEGRFNPLESIEEKYFNSIQCYFRKWVDRITLF
ncbi:hypothetical protein KVC54_00375 [Helicobacter pylori]|nr:hypothetical protein KVC54_00375 [Helicobacter pylori]